jgi:hypothetical protein
MEVNGQLPSCPLPLYHGCPLGTLGGSQSRSERCGLDEDLLLLPGIELRPSLYWLSHPAAFLPALCNWKGLRIFYCLSFHCVTRRIRTSYHIDQFAYRQWPLGSHFVLKMNTLRIPEISENWLQYTYCEDPEFGSVFQSNHVLSRRKEPVLDIAGSCTVNIWINCWLDAHQRHRDSKQTVMWGGIFCSDSTVHV